MQNKMSIWESCYIFRVLSYLVLCYFVSYIETFIRGKNANNMFSLLGLGVLFSGM